MPPRSTGRRNPPGRHRARTDRGRRRRHPPGRRTCPRPGRLPRHGKHELRGHRRPPGAINDLIGFKRHLTLTPAQAGILAGHVEVLLFPGGYAGLQPIPGGRANLCLVIAKDVHDRLDRDWDALIDYLARNSSVFAERLAGADPCWTKPLSIYGIPYGFVHRADGAIATYPPVGRPTRRYPVLLRRRHRHRLALRSTGGGPAPHGPTAPGRRRVRVADPHRHAARPRGPPSPPANNRHDGLPPVASAAQIDGIGDPDSRRLASATASTANVTAPWSSRRPRPAARRG